MSSTVQASVVSRSGVPEARISVELSVDVNFTDVPIRRMTLGSGYKYLMSSVARSDGASQHVSALTRYYAESGTPPGRFIGQGLAGLGSGVGIEPGSKVTEEHLFRMVGMVQDRLTGEQLGQSPRAQKVAVCGGGDQADRCRDGRSQGR
jgi:hypothetical protein